MSMQRFARLALVAMMLVACVGCDQTTKALARDHLQGRGTASFLDDTLRLQYVENPGAFLSLGESLPHHWRTAVFTVGAGAVLTAVLFYVFLASQARPVQIIALSLICSGGIGNLVDRVRYDGYVTDFLNIGIGPLRTGIFNLADVILMAGIVLFVFQQRRAERPPCDPGRAA
jgi:signal peptidase II